MRHLIFALLLSNPLLAGESARDKVLADPVLSEQREAIFSEAGIKDLKEVEALSEKTQDLMKDLIDRYNFGREGNGGDGTANDFTLSALRGVDFLRLHQIRLLNGSQNRNRVSDPILREVNISELESTITNSKVFTVDYKLCSRDDDQTCPEEKGFVAKNYNESNEIYVNEKRWNTLSPEEKVRISLHEYFGLMGLEKANYRYSSRVMIKDNFEKTGSKMVCSFNLLSCPTEGFSSTCKSKMLSVNGSSEKMNQFSKKISEDIVIKGNFTYGFLRISLIDDKGEILLSPIMVMKDEPSASKILLVGNQNLQVSCSQLLKTNSASVGPVFKRAPVVKE